MSIRKRRHLHNKLHILRSVFIDDDGHKRGQASRPVVGVEIQTTFKRTYIMVAAFWVLSSLTGLCCILNYLIALWLGRISISLFLLISIISYTKIFRTLSHHQAEVQHHVQQQLSQPNALNMVKYRKAVYSALLVQFALVVCYIPYFIIETLISQSNTDSLHLVVFWRLTIGLVQFNSTLNPFLYCW